MALLLFCGDPHGSFQAIRERVQQRQPDALILLGDLELPATFSDLFSDIFPLHRIWFIHGNHDTDNHDFYDRLVDPEMSAQNLHAHVMEVAGIRIAGLGGVFRRFIWYPPELPNYMSRSELIQATDPKFRWRDGVPRRHRSSIFPEDLIKLSEQSADILITHEAPAPHRYGFSVLNSLAETMGVKRIIHGHHHDPFHYQQAQYVNVGLRGFYELDTSRL